MKWKSLILVLGVIGIIVGISGCTSSDTTKNYTGSVMSFQYPSGWTVNEMNDNQTVNLTKSSDWIQVLLLGTAKSSNGLNDYLNEGIDLGNMYKSQGFYHDNISNQSYQVFTDDGNSPEITYYLFTKNGKYYEIRGTGDLDAYDQIMETIK